MILLNTKTTYLSIMSSGPVPNSPLKVCRVIRDEGVDGAHTSVSPGGVVGGLRVSGGRGLVSRSVSHHDSLKWLFCLSLFESVDIYIKYVHINL